MLRGLRGYRSTTEHPFSAKFPRSLPPAPRRFPAPHPAATPLRKRHDIAVLGVRSATANGTARAPSILATVILIEVATAPSLFTLFAFLLRLCCACAERCDPLLSCTCWANVLKQLKDYLPPCFRLSRPAMPATLRVSYEGFPSRPPSRLSLISKHMSMNPALRLAALVRG